MTNASILIAADHAGYNLKTILIDALRKKGVTVKDLGTDSADSVDYPDFGQKAAKAILNGEAEKGVIVCGTGIGISIAANRFKGIRAAPVASVEMARLARQHNDANLLALAGRFMSPEQAVEIVDVFLSTAFEGDRHQNRIVKLDKAE